MAGRVAETTLRGINIEVEVDEEFGFRLMEGAQVLGSPCWFMSGADEVRRVEAREVVPWVCVWTASRQQTMIRA